VQPHLKLALLTAVAVATSLRDWPCGRRAIGGGELRIAAHGTQSDVGSSLLERAPDLAEISRCIRAAGAGEGCALVLEGPAGIGKTALLTAACDEARRAGMATLTARAGELETGLPWGVVRGLFEPALAAASRAERRDLLSDAAGLARIALRSDGGHTAPRRADALGAALHGLYWLTANIAARRPVLMAIDDAHWADKPSLRWLAYLVARLEGLPVLVVTTVRPGEPGTPSGAISAIARGGGVVQPSPLSREATAMLVRATLGEEASADLCESCHSATAGNPFLLRCLLVELRDRGDLPDGASTESVTEIHSDAISRAVLARLARLPEIARELASAVSVFGASCSLGDAAAIAGLDDDAAIAAADALAAQDVIAKSEPLEFVHPIVRTAVYHEIPSHRRVRWHARAARLLDEAEAPPDEIAVHLLSLAPNSDATVVGILRSAAAAALRAGAPESAVEYLSRAVAEPPPARTRVAILRELGAAEASLEDPAGAEHLQEALSLSSQPSERAEIARELAVPLMHSGQMHEAVELLERAAGGLAASDRELRLVLEADIIGARRLHPALRRTALERVMALRAARLPGRTFGERVALSAVALELESPAGTAAESIECAERALGGGRLLAEGGVESPAFWYAAIALILADAFDLADQVVESALAEARLRASTVGLALGLGFRALLGYRTGRLAEAEADARQALDVSPSARWAGSVYALLFLIEVLLERDRPDDAAQALVASGLDTHDGELLPLLLMRHGRGRLSLALGDEEAGLRDMRAAAAQLEAGAFPPQLWPWRSTHALALAAVGETKEACRLADQELRLTRAFEAPGPLGISLRTRGLVEPGAADLDRLREAVAVLAGSGAALEHARALVELGAALRRAGHRVKSIKSLREGLDLAHRCGASALAARARGELVTAGARPRRDALHGRDALTASELRTARLAAAGRTNREIAQELFVGVRTVETHLTHAYQKLAIQSRDALPAALAREP
jgi:DNA-binding CsgD family transcriptional regulator